MKTADKCKILLVDDNPADRYILKEAAGEQGVSMHGCECATAEEALARLEEGEKPKLILFDLRLNGISGLDLLKELKSREDWRHIPAIAYSGSVSPEDARQAYALHANCVVRKPHDIQDLRHLVRLLDEFWLRWVVSAD